jgi:ElaB/YqjD/DUF883 family membrane-anchored ribosome-binding protein
MTTSMKDYGAAVDATGEAVSSAMANASEKVEETVASVKQTAVESFDRVESAIRRNPLAAASIAGGVGFFLAILARR